MPPTPTENRPPHEPGRAELLLGRTRGNASLPRSWSQTAPDPSPSQVNSPKPQIHRRRFLQTGLLGATALGTWSIPGSTSAAATKLAADPFRGLKMGITSYILRKFTLDQAIDMTREAGLKYISLKDVHLPLKSTSEESRQARQKIEAAGLVLMGAGVIYMKGQADEIRAAFEYVKNAGIPTMICAPDPAALDTVEKLAREYDVRIAIHNHGPDNSQYPSPLDVLRLVKDRDAHLGICMDVGHTVRLGQDPVLIMRQCANRLYDFHVKDVTEATAKGVCIEVGRGVIDIVAVLRTLLELKFSGHVALEHEAHPEAPMPGILESLAYLRGALAAL